VRRWHVYRTREEIERMSVPTSVPVQEAARRLDEEGFGIVLVLDEGGRLAGIMTNGDFRRFILGGGSLGAPVTRAMNPRPITVELADSPSLEDALGSCFSQEGIRYVPVLDGFRKLLDVVFRSDLEDDGVIGMARQLPEGCPVVVMAGGRGTRLDPFTRILPKPLIPVGERPIIEIILERFHRAGVRHFWLSINHKGRMIRAYFEEAATDYTVDFLDEEQPLGTAGALHQLAGKFEVPLFVTNCDILVMADYSSIHEFHLAGGYDLTLVGSAQQHTIPYGICELGEDGRLRRIVEKPRYDVVVNTGMYVVSPGVLHGIPAGRRVDMTDLIGKLLKSGGSVGVYPVPESAWLDVGQWEEFRKAVKLLGGMDG